MPQMNYNIGGNGSGQQMGGSVQQMGGNGFLSQFNPSGSSGPPIGARDGLMQMRK